MVKRGVSLRSRGVDFVQRGVSHCVFKGSFWVREVRKVRRVRMMDFGGKSSQLKILANFYIIFLRNFKYFFYFCRSKI